MRFKFKGFCPQFSAPTSGETMCRIGTHYWVQEWYGPTLSPYQVCWGLYFVHRRGEKNFDVVLFCFFFKFLSVTILNDKVYERHFIINALKCGNDCETAEKYGKICFYSSRRQDIPIQMKYCTQAYSMRQLLHAKFVRVRPRDDSNRPMDAIYLAMLPVLQRLGSLPTFQPFGIALIFYHGGVLNFFLLSS